MRCKNCEAENKEGALYCGKCGQPLKKSKKKKKGLAIALVIIGICVIALGVVWFLVITRTNQKNNYNEKMSLGDKYFQQMKYEDAILAYSDAINIDRKQPEAYIALSQVYVENKNYEAAYEILQSAPMEEMKEVQKQIIEEQISDLEEQDTSIEDSVLEEPTQEPEKKISSDFERSASFKEVEGKIYSSYKDWELQDSEEIKSLGDHVIGCLYYKNKIYINNIDFSMTKSDKPISQLTRREINGEDEVVLATEIAIKGFCAYNDKVYCNEYSELEEGAKGTCSVDLVTGEVKHISDSSLKFIFMTEEQWIYQDIETKKYYVSAPDLENTMELSWSVMDGEEVYADEENIYYQDNEGILHVLKNGSLDERKEINLKELFPEYKACAVEKKELYVIIPDEGGFKICVVDIYDIENQIELSYFDEKLDVTKKWSIDSLAGKYLFFMPNEWDVFVCDLETQEIILKIYGGDI